MPLAIKKRLRKTLLKPSNVMRIMRLYALITGKPQLHFLHIGKTGGSAIKSVIRSYRFKMSYVIHARPHRITLADIPKGQKVFFGVRDPVARFVSGFYSRFTEGGIEYNAPWTPEERIAFDTFKTPDALACALSLKGSTGQMAQRAMKGIGHINTSYWDWFISPEYFMERLGDVTMVLQQELLDEHFELLRNYLSLPQEVNLRSPDVKNHYTPKRFNKELSSVGVENLKNWYKSDYDFLELLNAQGLIQLELK